MSHVIPTLGYRDPRTAVRFLVESLGFELVVLHDDEDAGEVHHAELRWPEGGSVYLHTGSAAQTVADLAAGDPEDGYPAASVHLLTGDPDAVYTRAVKAGAKVVRELQDRPHGTRDFIVADPEGLYWSVGTRLPPLVRDPGGRWRPADAVF